MSRALSVTICALLLLMSFGSVVQPRTPSANFELNDRPEYTHVSSGLPFSESNYGSTYPNGWATPYILPSEYRNSIAVDDNFLFAATGDSADPHNIEASELRYTQFTSADIGAFTDPLDSTGGNWASTTLLATSIPDNDSVIVAYSNCHNLGFWSYNTGIPHQPPCTDEGIESEGTLVDIIKVENFNSSTIVNIGNVTYENCGYTSGSGGGSSWNRAVSTPVIQTMRVNHFDNGGFRLLLAHRHHNWPTTANGPGGQSNDYSACDILVNGHKVGDLYPNTVNTIDIITFDPNIGTPSLTRILAGPGVETDPKLANDVVIYQNYIDASSPSLYCHNLTTSTTVAYPENTAVFASSSDYLYTDTLLVPIRVTDPALSQDQFKLMNPSTCSSVYSQDKFRDSTKLNMYSTEDGNTHIIGSRRGNDVNFAMPFNTTMSMGSEFYVTVSPNGTVGNAPIHSATSTAYDGQGRGYRSIPWGDFYPRGNLRLEDGDRDGYADMFDRFPFDGHETSDYDEDGIGNNGDDCPLTYGNSTLDLLGCTDSDGDGQSDQGDSFVLDWTQITDVDSDGYGDNLTGTFGDACPSIYGESTRDRYGCPDADFDGWSDDNDTFPNDSSQWEDSDGDGYGDQLIGFEGDACPATPGNSTEDRYGCPDADGDGWSDDGDDMPSNPTQWKDRDGDGYGDNATGTMADDFPSDGTQWNDTDGDGHGDNPYGSEGDWFPGDPERWSDADRDGVADGDDAFVNDATQWNDTDGDGHGDELAGNQGDAFPEDPEEWQDSDSDGVGNNADDFPFDPSQQTDSDGDGFGDNPLGSGADKFPDHPSQWSDIDGDGYGDNQTGNNSDAFIADPTQWSDADGDGHGDNPSGRLPDLFPTNPTQWLDQDGDGLGDNLSGIDADPYLFDFDNDGYNDSIDILPKLPSPDDLDNDGCPDAVDAFPTDFRECKDFDGDGVGDNADTDDDDDGWTDTDEIREGTDPLDPNEYPVETFQLVIPGTTIGLDAWDLIGIFGGFPIFGWILFGFITRNKRAGRFEEQLKAAVSKDELEEIALKSEYSLMIRLIGAHQGIRLERLRAELDDAMDEAVEAFDEDQTEIVDDEITESNTPAFDARGQVGPDGYEWIRDGDAAWYRVPNSEAEWQPWRPAED